MDTFQGSSSASRPVASAQGDLEFPDVLQGLEKELAGVALSDTVDTGLTAATSSTLNSSQVDPAYRDGQGFDKGRAEAVEVKTLDGSRD
jgi:hypothetical protein